jgi:arylsulfatase A-like enzyme
MQTHETDVTAIAFYGVDVMSHLTWHFMEPEQFPRFTIPDKNIRRFGGTIPSYYAFVDSLLGSLLSHAPANATVMVLSDHGFGPTGNLPWSGGHGKITPGAPIAPDGILIISGQPIRKGDTIKPAHVTDILPTLLYLQGFPIAKDLKGRVLRDAIRPDILEDYPIRWIDTYEITPRSDIWDSLLVDDTIDQHTIEKLKSLGYL